MFHPYLPLVVMTLIVVGLHLYDKYGPCSYYASKKSTRERERERNFHAEASQKDSS